MCSMLYVQLLCSYRKTLFILTKHYITLVHLQPTSPLYSAYDITYLFVNCNFTFSHESKHNDKSLFTFCRTPLYNRPGACLEVIVKPVLYPLITWACVYHVYVLYGRRVYHVTNYLPICDVAVRYRYTHAQISCTDHCSSYGCIHLIVIFAGKF